MRHKVKAKTVMSLRFRFGVSPVFLQIILDFVLFVCYVSVGRYPGAYPVYPMTYRLKTGPWGFQSQPKNGYISCASSLNPM